MSLAQIEIKEALHARDPLHDSVQNRFVLFASLREGTVIHPIGLESGKLRKQGIFNTQAVKRRRALDDIARISAAVDLHNGGSSRVVRIRLYKLGRKAERIHLSKRAFSALVGANRGEQGNLVSQALCVGREVQRRTSQEFLPVKDIPQDLTEADDLHLNTPFPSRTVRCD